MSKISRNSGISPLNQSNYIYYNQQNAEQSGCNIFSHFSRKVIFYHFFHNKVFKRVNSVYAKSLSLNALYTLLSFYIFLLKSISVRFTNMIVEYELHTCGRRYCVKRNLSRLFVTIPFISMNAVIDNTIL